METHWQLMFQHNPLNLKRFGTALLARCRQWWDPGQVTEDDQVLEWLKAQLQPTLKMIPASLGTLDRAARSGL